MCASNPPEPQWGGGRTTHHSPLHQPSLLLFFSYFLLLYSLCLFSYILHTSATGNLPAVPSSVLFSRRSNLETSVLPFDHHHENVKLYSRQDNGASGWLHGWLPAKPKKLKMQPAWCNRWLELTNVLGASAGREVIQGWNCHVGFDRDSRKVQLRPYTIFFQSFLSSTNRKPRGMLPSQHAQPRIEVGTEWKQS